MKTFLEYLNNRLLIESEKNEAQAEAEEFIGQGYITKIQEIQDVLKKYNLQFDNWDGPLANASVATMTKAIESAKIGSISPNDIPKLNNFANKVGDQAAVQTILDFRKNNPNANPKDPENYKAIRQAYTQAMNARDKAEDRKREYSDVGSNLDRVNNNEYAPPVIFNSGGKKIVIGGRTRLYAALALNLPIKVKELTEQDIATAVAKK